MSAEEREIRPTLRQNLQGLPRAAWVLFAGAFVNRLGTFVLPFITLYLTSRGYSVPQAGLGLAAYGAGAIGAQGAGGLLADRIGRRNTIVVSSFGGAALTLSLIWVSGLWDIVGVVALLGFVAELYRPAASALIADLIEPQARVAAFSAYRLALNLGFACGLSLGGILAAHSYHLLFVGDALTSALFGIIALVALPHGTRTTKEQERHLAGAGRMMAADKGFLLFLGAVFVTAAVYMQNASTFALHVVALGYSTKVYGLLQAMNGVLVVLLELPISAWTQHRPRTRMIALGALLVGVGFAELAFVKALPGLLLMVVDLDARRDHRVTGDRCVRRRPSPRTRARPLPGSPGDDVRVRGGRRATRRDLDLPPQPGCPVDRVRRGGMRCRGVGARRRSPSGSGQLR